MPKSIARQTALSICDVLIQGITLVLLYAFLVRTLSVVEMGLWAIVSSVAAIGRVFDLGLGRGLVRYIPLQSAPQSIAHLLDSAVVGTALLIVPAVAIAFGTLRLGLPLAVPQHVEQGLALIPWSLALLAALLLSGVYLNALTAIYRSDLRAIVNIVGNVLMVVAATLFAPVYGIVGVFMAQIIQHIALTIVALMMLRRNVVALRWLPTTANKADLRTIGAYGIKLQGASLAMVAFEPAARLMLGRFGSLDSVVYYDMASRLIQQVRSLVLTANQVMSPYFSALSEGQTQDLIAVYRRSVSITCYFAVPALALLAASSPLMSVLWIGHRQPQFIAFSALLVVGWLINVMSAPAYFVATSSGVLRPIVVSHVIITLAMLAIGLPLGMEWGSEGVVIAVSLGLILGALYCVIAVHKYWGHPLQLLDASDAKYFAFCAAVAAIALAIEHLMVDAGSPYTAPGITAVSAGALMLAAFLIHANFRVIKELKPGRSAGVRRE